MEARDVLNAPPERGPRIGFDRVHAAREQLERVIVAHPGCASAYVLLARAYSALTYDGPKDGPRRVFRPLCRMQGYVTMRTVRFG
jgi:hypothetical protein